MKRACAILFAAVLLVGPPALLSTTQPITLTTLLAISQSSPNINVSLGNSNSGISWAGAKFCQGIMAVPTTAGGTAIPCLSSLSNLGYASYINLDAANNITLITAVSGTNMVLLKPGDSAVFRYPAAITAPAAVASTGTSNLQFLVIEN